MKHYVMIFRATRPLTPEEQKQRGVEIGIWVKQVTGMGITLDPRNLGEVVANLSTQGNEVVSRSESNDPAFVTMVFFDAADQEQAVKIARIHPGLHYGVTVELREWSTPAPLTARP